MDVPICNPRKKSPTFTDSREPRASFLLLRPAELLFRGKFPASSGRYPLWTLKKEGRAQKRKVTSTQMASQAAFQLKDTDPGADITME